MTNRIIKRTAGACIVPLMMLFGTGSALAQDDPGFETLSDPFTDLTNEELQDFVDGLEVFERGFGPPQGGGGSGVGGGGPLRNTFGSNSCVACHGSAQNPTTGGLDNTKDGGASVAFRASQATAYDEVAGTCDHLGDRGGPGFQTNTLNLRVGPFVYNKRPQEPAHADDFANGEYIPLYSKDGVLVGPRDDRTTNDLFGLGLLDAITDQKLSTLEDPDDSNGDGISGRIHWVTDHHGNVHAGKFGRRAEVAHLDEFNAEAFQNEQGVTNHEFPDDGFVVTCADLTDPDGIPNNGDEICNDDLVNLQIETLFDSPFSPFPPAPHPHDVSDDDLDLMNAYVRFLAPPEQNPGAMSKRDRNQGSRIFRQTGCADCHTPQLTTGASEHDALNHKVIKPYSDLLLHDMGVDLAEGCKGGATPSEWRTEPLWGLRFVPTAVGYMHDGRAADLDLAILAHAGEGSEANGSVDKYEGLKESDKQLLLDFLNTL